MVKILKQMRLLESQDILDIYRDFNLNPTMAWPIELKRGLPHNAKI